MRKTLPTPLMAFALMAWLFQTVPAQRLTVTSPRKGQVWNPGEYHAITWTGISNPDTFVRLEYSTDAGDTWRLITDSAVQSVYIWRLPEVNSRYCKVRASAGVDTTIMLIGHMDFVNTGSYSNDGKLVVTASDDQTAIVWNARSGERLQTYTGHTDDVMYACFSPDDKQLLTSSFDGTAGVWDVASGRRLFTMRNTNGVAAMNYSGFSPDGVLIATPDWDNAVRIWNGYNGQFIKALQGHADIVASSFFHPRGDRLISASRDASVIIWDIQTGSVIKRITLPAASDWAAWSPAGDRFVAACRDGNAYVFDAQTYELKGALSFHTSWVWSAEFSKDGRFIITGGRDGNVAIWDAQSFAKIRSFVICSTDVSAARFSPDGTEFLAVSNDYLGRITRIMGSNNRNVALSDSLFAIVPKATRVDQSPGDLSVSLSPNPAHDVLTLHAPGCTPAAQVVISDALGSVVMHRTLAELPQEQLSISALASGMYVVSIQDGPLSAI
ncbi:MAG: T9SS type A sorting domain-containing protein, partial [Candidatus Kapaibacterium sp.]